MDHFSGSCRSWVGNQCSMVCKQAYANLLCSSPIGFVTHRFPSGHSYPKSSYVSIFLPVILTEPKRCSGSSLGLLFVTERTLTHRPATLHKLLYLMDVSCSSLSTKDRNAVSSLVVDAQAQLEIRQSALLLTIRVSAHVEIHHSMAKLPVLILFHCQLLSQVLQCRFVLGGGRREGTKQSFY